AAVPDEIALVCFDAGGQDYALPLASVHEVIAYPESVAALPQPDAVMLGVTTLRGQMLPLVSLCALLGLPSRVTDGDRRRVVVARIGEGLVGLVTDGMKEI